MAVIICIILSILLVYMCGNYLTLYASSKEKISEFVNEFVDDVYPCKLFATVRYERPHSQTVVDMSQYEKLGVIGITIDKIESPSTIKEKAINNEPIFYSPAVVYKVGGHWLWKVL